MFRRSVLVLALAAISSDGSAQVYRKQKPPEPVTVTGVLKGANGNHDGHTEWLAFVATEAAAYLLVGGGKDFNELKQLVGKRVSVRGTLITEVQDGGKMVPLTGTVGGIRYVGNFTIAAIADVQLQAITELTGTVKEVEQPSAADPKKPVKLLQLSSSGDKPTVYTASPEAAKALKEHLGKTVRVRGYVTGDRIEAVDSTAPVEPAK
ncbi:MAG TPA: hypothetical protein VK348_11415 [Planctomycetota bacterium]|nr:hypothetical protein [Planctomycetota bacterium]